MLGTVLYCELPEDGLQSRVGVTEQGCLALLLRTIVLYYYYVWHSLMAVCRHLVVYLYFFDDTPPKPRWEAIFWGFAAGRLCMLDPLGELGLFTRGSTASAGVYHVEEAPPSNPPSLPQFPVFNT